MSTVPFILSLDSPPYYEPDMFPNRMYRRQHARHHEPLDMHTLGQIARLATKRSDEMSLLAKNDKNGFEIHLDVGLFQANELSVKIVDHAIVVEGKHEEREDDHGYISRHFVRRYVLPKGYDPETVASTISSDGVLTVRAPKPPQEKSDERIIQIQQTGPSDLFINKTNNKENDKEK